GAADAFRFDVVCFPIIDWDFRFQRPQQLMSRFASAGHRVFYVSHRFRQSGAAWEVVPKAENVFEVTLYAPGLNVYRNRPSPGAVDLLFFSLDALRRDLALGPAAAIVQLPFWWPLARRARREFAWPAVYDCMDLHAGFATNSPDMIGSEEEMLREADLVSVSSALLEGIARERNPAVRVVRNACDYDHFAVAPKAPGPRPVVGYYGAISEWFDSDLAADLARRCPDFDFVLIGSTYGADLRPLARLPNVRFVGERPYSEIPGWLGTFDAAILPFRRTPLTEATNPVKAYEIFAAGKPLIAVDLPELRLLEPLVRIASDAAGFERQIRAALAEDPAAASRRQAFARENTWEARRRELAPAIAAAFPRVSIVVVTYENREMNRACLDSIRAVTGWPNLQVVVVDNGSTDGTADDLRARAETGEIVAVLNDANRGFAAANNQGLARADGEYIVLLNNDTVVTRGWLATLVRRLAADASIGLIGPSTNAIGNEAQVDVEYDGLAAMPGWAANFVRANDGVAFTIPMLAMFCVAFPRRVFEAVGPLDERFGLGMFEDDDYSHRVRAAGYGIVCCRDAFVHHWMKASFRRLPEEEYRTLFETNRRLFEEKWGVSWKPHRSAPPPPGGVDEIPDAG
ncbi:MAG TPA: glycosyltransferase, partial [Thermoanaerobaculia bacterium]|nr:glycosyltransferase [Thermoanaerobaculia bacterium]